MMNTYHTEVIQMHMKDNKHGFTLSELLVVIVVIAALVVIAVPVMGARIEKARQATDMANMRSAASVLVAGYVTGDYQANIRYYFDAEGSKIVNTSPSTGYGKSKTNAREFWTGNGTASGIPAGFRGHPAVLSMTIDSDGDITYLWGGEYSGENVTSKEEYEALSDKEKIAKDKLLLDSLQKDIRDMTYGELWSLFFNEDGSYKADFKNPKGASGDNLNNGKIDGFACFAIARGAVDGTTHDVITGGQSGIYTKGIFADAGFDTQLAPDETYLINSVTDTTQIIWVNLRIDEKEFKELNKNKNDPSSKWNQTASNAYTYLKSSGKTTPDDLKESVRKKG